MTFEVLRVRLHCPQHRCPLLSYSPALSGLLSFKRQGSLLQKQLVLMEPLESHEPQVALHIRSDLREGCGDDNRGTYI
jgi:hypothetical protein